MKKCMLIGGAGFLGQNIAKQLCKDLHVLVVDKINCNDLFRGYNNIDTINIDYFNNGIEEELLYDMDYIILLACSIGPQSSMITPLKGYSIDIPSMISLLDNIKGKKSRLFFISSGGTVYGEHKEEILCESLQTYPINHYGIIKLTQEKIIGMYNKMYSMKNIVVRVANPYGMGQTVSSGIGAVTTFLDKIMHDEKIYIWGDGTIIRDYIYIEDVVCMIEKLLKLDIDVDEGNYIYNIGTGVGTSLNKLIMLVENITNKKASVEYSDARCVDVKRNVLDNSKIISVIGPYNCISVEEGLKKYLKSKY